MIPNQRIVLAPNWIRNDLGNRQAFVQNGARSYSQQGNFANVRRQGQSLVATSPRTDPGVSLGTIVPRTWNVTGKLLICISDGQSKGGGFTPSTSGVPDPTQPFTELNPMAKLQCFTGGVSPLQSGVTISSVNVLVDAAQIATLVPAHNNINTNRAGGQSFDHEQPILSYAETIAAAVPDGNVVVAADFSIGGGVFNQTVINVLTITSLTWLAGTATLVLSASTVLANAGDQIFIAGATGTAWNSPWTLLTSDGTTMTFAVVSNPGTVGAATCVVWAPAMANVRTAVRDLVTNKAPALGLTPQLVSLNIYGFEGDTSITTAAVWVTNQWYYLRAIATELGNIVDGNANGIPWVVWSQPDYTMFEWTVGLGMQSTANPQTFGLRQTSLDTAQRLITTAQYGNRGGGLGDATTTSSHCGVQGYSDMGELEGNLRLDVANGITTTSTPPQIDTTNGLLMTANVKSIAGKFTEAVTIDTSGRITTIDNYGVHVFAGAYSGGNGYNISANSFTLAANGIDFTVGFPSFPTDFGGMYVGIAYDGAYASPAANSTPILSVSWAADVATFTTASAHGIGVGDTVSIGLFYPVAYDVTTTALAGTTGSTLKLAVVGDPGTLALSGATWANGVATYTLTTGTHLMAVGNYVTTTSFAIHAGYNVTSQPLRSVTTTTFSIRMNTDPGGADVGGGAVVGGGQIADTGNYGSGNVNGLRSQLMAPNPYYSHRSGAALPRRASHQFAPVTVNPSSKSIVTMLSELNLTSHFPMVLNAANATCYPGTGTAVTNLGTGTTNDDYTMQNGIVFVGSAGSLDRTSYFNASGTNRYLSNTNTPDVFTNLHKISGKGTALVGLHIPASLAGTNYILATTDGSKNGFRLQIASSLAVNFNVTNDSAGSVVSRSNGFAVANDYCIVGFGVDNLNNSSWVLNANSTTVGTAGFLTFNPVFASPGTGAAQSPLLIGKNGTGATLLATGVQVHWVLCTDEFFTVGQITPLYNGLFRELMLNLP